MLPVTVYGVCLLWCLVISSCLFSPPSLHTHSWQVHLHCVRAQDGLIYIYIRDYTVIPRSQCACANCAQCVHGARDASVLKQTTNRVHPPRLLCAQWRWCFKRGKIIFHQLFVWSVVFFFFSLFWVCRPVPDGIKPGCPVPAWAAVCNKWQN